MCVAGIPFVYIYGALLCNDVSHWLSANLVSPLTYILWVFGLKVRYLAIVAKTEDRLFFIKLCIIVTVGLMISGFVFRFRVVSLDNLIHGKFLFFIACALVICQNCSTQTKYLTTNFIAVFFVVKITCIKTSLPQYVRFGTFSLNFYYRNRDRCYNQLYC